MQNLNEFNIVNNKSKIYYNGSVWDTKKYGKLKILEKLKRRDYFLCQFDDGTLVESQVGHIIEGTVKNRFHPDVYGVGYLGVGNAISAHNGKHSKEYRLWCRMLERCYSEKYHLIRPTYKIVTVDERWFNFQNFYNDIKNLKGYIEWYNYKVGKNKYVLDKDVLCDKLNINPKIYSKDTCVFITQRENVQQTFK